MGGWDGFLYALITFVAIDYLTGVMAAILDKRLCSEVGTRGIFKKVLIFALVAVGHMIDMQVLSNGNAIRTSVVFFYLSNEGISIFEKTATAAARLQSWENRYGYNEIRITTGQEHGHDVGSGARTKTTEHRRVFREREYP